MIEHRMRIVLVILLVIILCFFCSGCVNRQLPVNSISKDSKEKLEIILPPGFMPEYRKDWKIINNKIKRSINKNIILYNNGYGGYDYMGDTTIAAIQSAQYKGSIVTMIIDIHAISMHANIVCYSNIYKLNNKSVLIFHAGFYRSSKGKKIYSKDRSYFDMCKYKQILTEEDIHQMLYNAKRVEIYANGTKQIKDDWK